MFVQPVTVDTIILATNFTGRADCSVVDIHTRIPAYTDIQTPQHLHPMYTYILCIHTYARMWVHTYVNTHTYVCVCVCVCVCVKRYERFCGIVQLKYTNRRQLLRILVNRISYLLLLIVIITGAPWYLHLNDPIILDALLIRLSNDALV